MLGWVTVDATSSLAWPMADPEGGKKNWPASQTELDDRQPVSRVSIYLIIRDPKGGGAQGRMDNHSTKSSQGAITTARLKEQNGYGEMRKMYQVNEPDRCLPSKSFN